MDTEKKTSKITCRSKDVKIKPEFPLVFHKIHQFKYFLHASKYAWCKCVFQCRLSLNFHRKNI